MLESELCLQEIGKRIIESICGLKDGIETKLHSYFCESINSNDNKYVIQRILDCIDEI